MTIDPRTLHIAAVERHRLSAIAYIAALESGDRYAAEVAYQDCHEAYIDANEAFCDLIKGVFGIGEAA